MSYKDQYQTLPPKAQKAIRELMTALVECDRRHPLIDQTVCSSSFESAVANVERCAYNIKKSDAESRGPRGYLRNTLHVYAEDQ